MCWSDCYPILIKNYVTPRRKHWAALVRRTPLHHSQNPSRTRTRQYAGQRRRRSKRCAADPRLKPPWCCAAKISHFEPHVMKRRILLVDGDGQPLRELRAEFAALATAWEIVATPSGAAALASLALTP